MAQERREWFLHLDCTDVGPLISKELRALAATGLINGDTPVKRLGMKDWMRARQFGGLFEGALATTPAPIAAVPDIAPRTGTETPAIGLMPPPARTIISQRNPLAALSPMLRLLLGAVVLNFLLLGLVIGYSLSRPAPVPQIIHLPAPIQPVTQTPDLPPAPAPMTATATDLTPPITALDPDRRAIAVGGPDYERVANLPPVEDPAIAAPAPAVMSAPPLTQLPSSTPAVVESLPIAPPTSSPGLVPPPEPPAVAAQPERPPAVVAIPTLPAGLPPYAWDQCPTSEHASVDTFLQHGSWVHRCFGLLRLERFQGLPVQERLAVAIKDPDWHVRCFALRFAQRTSIPLPADCLAAETNPQVLRTAARNGTILADAQVESALRELRARGHIEDHLTAIELQACIRDARHRREANNAMSALIHKLKDEMAMVLEPRLNVLTGLVDGPPEKGGILLDPLRPYQDGLANRWKHWLKEQGNGEFFTDQVRPEAGGLPAIALLDADDANVVWDYLGQLSHRQLEVAILLDATGSMALLIRRALQQVNRLVVVCSHLNQSMRVGFVAFRDGNGTLAEDVPLTDEIDDVRTFLGRVRAGGGAGFAGVVHALERVVSNKWKWNKDATRQLVVIGDAPVATVDLKMTLELLGSASKNTFITHLVAVGGALPWQSLEGMVKQGGGRSVQAPSDIDLARLVLELSLDPEVVTCFGDFYESFVTMCL